MSHILMCICPEAKARKPRRSEGVHLLPIRQTETSPKELYFLKPRGCADWYQTFLQGKSKWSLLAPWVGERAGRWEALTVWPRPLPLRPATLHTQDPCADHALLCVPSTLAASTCAHLTTHWQRTRMVERNPSLSSLTRSSLDSPVVPRLTR